MNSRVIHYVKLFFGLFLFTCLGIFLHECSHHFFGIPSLLGLSRNYPLVPVTDQNMIRAITGSLAGPFTNLLFAYIGLFLYKSFSNNKVLCKMYLYFGISNGFITLSSAVINLIVDTASQSMANDLQSASVLMGIPILILPLIFSLLSLIPLRVFWRDSSKIAPNKTSFAAIIFLAWLVGGSVLMAADALFNIRII